MYVLTVCVSAMGGASHDYSGDDDHYHVNQANLDDGNFCSSSHRNHFLSRSRFSTRRGTLAARGSGGGRGVRTTIINLRSASRSSLFGRLVISFHLQLISVQKMLDYSLYYRIVLTLCGPNKRPVWQYNDELIVCDILFWKRLLENA